MSLINLFNGVVILIICYCLNTEVISVKIECVPVESCPFALKVLSRKYVSPSSEIWNLFKISKCGYEEGTNKLMIWCTKFTNCRTPDNQFGTCIPVKRCAVLANLLYNNMSVELKNKFLSDRFICNLPQESDTHVCCPWSVKTARSEMGQRLATPEKESTERARRDTYPPWFAPNNENNFFDAGLNSPIYQNFHSRESDSEEDNTSEDNNNFGWSNFGFQPGKNIFTQQNTNFFNQLQSGQRDSINGLQNSLQQQNKWLQSALKNTTNRISGENQNINNQFLNWWNWLPAKNGYSKYNLTEETSDSKREVCITPDNLEGICKEIRQCPTFLNALGRVSITDSIQTEYLKKFNCSSTSSNLKVCCSENTISFPANDSSTDQSETRTQERTRISLDSVSNICGRQIVDDKIIGGTNTDLAEFPWTALLQYSTPTGLVFGCGGTVINNRYILTAAHCVNVDILRQAGFQKLDRVILGEYDRRNETDCIYTRYGSECADPPQIFGVDRIIEHKLFKSNDTPNDIALVRLDKEINFSSYVRPICLPNVSSLNLRGNENFTITGWGRTESGEASNVKRKAQIPFINKDNCSLLGPLNPGQMCLGSGKGTDSCKGDSGGPVMLRTVLPSNDVVTILVGIISFGFGRCGTTTSVSTYVPNYIDWILKNMS